MKPIFSPWVLLCLALQLTLLLALPAQSKTVWRCGEGGKVYSDSPCPGGRAVAVADPRSAADVQTARDSIKRSEDLATRMRRERLAEEKRNLAANAGAANLGPNNPSSSAAGKSTNAGEKGKPKTPSKRRLEPTESAANGTWRAAAVPSPRKRD